MDDKYPDSPRLIEINSLCTDSRFGTEANFADAISPLTEMVRDIVKLEDLDYRTKLTKSEINNIESARNSVIQFINQIKNFSLSLPNPVEQRNQIVAQIENYYQNAFATAIHPALVYLELQIKANAKDEKQLKELVTKTEAINRDLEDRLKAIKEREQKLEKDQASLSVGQGIVSSKYLSEQFLKESEKANTRAINWQKYWVLPLATFLVLAICGWFFGYFHWIRIIDNKYLSIEYTISGITLIALIFFYLRIVLRNSNIEKHTSSLNKHRANVASTIEGLLSVAEQDQSLKDALLKEASVAMFNVGSTGYLDKEQMEVSTPVKEVITTLIKNNQG